MKKSPKILAVEAEFEEDFDEVVAGFALMGYSRSACASILGFNLSYFRQICSKRDLHRHFKPQKDMRRECRKTSGGGWPKGKKRPFSPKYTDNVLSEEVKRWQSKRNFEVHSDIASSTVLRRFGSWANARRIANGQTQEQGRQG